MPHRTHDALALVILVAPVLGFAGGAPHEKSTTCSAVPERHASNAENSRFPRAASSFPMQGRR